MADYRKTARRAAIAHGLDPDIFERQINAESGFDPAVISGARSSPAGAQGIAQIMPATARGWGVNPLNPREALDAAAANMARYVRQFGSYDKALRAYNAGPGNVARSKGFAETNAYVRKILAGTSGKARGAGKLTQGDVGRTVTTTTPGVDYSAERGALIRSFLEDNSFDPVEFATQFKALKDIPGTTSTRTIRSATQGAVSAGGPSSSEFGSKHSKLLELIYNTGGRGFAVKDGQRVNGPQFYSGVWQGHRDHVHVAAGPKTVVELGKLAEQMGLHVGENPHFGGVDPVHVPGSYHYKGEAIDVSGDAGKMARFASRVQRLYGL